MKRILMYLILFFVVLTNIYLIFYWEPQSKSYIQETVSTETASYAKSLYKIDKYKGLEQLSVDDKKKLEKIMKKLSAFDMGKIKEYYEDSDEDKGVIEAFKLFRKRLTAQDYESMEEITSSFLDIKEINKKIKNN
jgi:hypothetical protein